MAIVAGHGRVTYRSCPYSPTSAVFICDWVAEAPFGYVLALPVDTITTAINQRIQKAYGAGAALAPGASHPMALAVFENALAQALDHTIRLRHIFVDMLAAAPEAIYPSEGEG